MTVSMEIYGELGKKKDSSLAGVEKGSVCL
jgi:hypothetical protein